MKYPKPTPPFSFTTQPTIKSTKTGKGYVLMYDIRSNANPVKIIKLLNVKLHEI